MADEEDEAGHHDQFVATAVDALESLTRDRVPALEYVLIDLLATWLFSEVNPGADYSENHAGQLISILFTALRVAHQAEPAEAPADEGPVDLSRDHVVAGAHELAALGAQGVTTLITRAMPAMLGELGQHQGNPGAQLHSGYYHLLFVVAAGADGRGSEEAATGLLTSFQGWDGLFASGAVARLQPPDAS